MTDPVPMPTVPPSPEPAPVKPVFPFSEASAALRALDDAVDDLVAMAAQHRALTGELVLGGSFHGAVRHRFEDQVIEASQRISPEATATLEANRAWLVLTIAAAHAREDQYLLDLAAWQARAQAPAPSVPV